MIDLKKIPPFKKINLTILAIIIALVGLISIQYIWIKTAIRLQNDNFDNEVKTVLSTIVDKIEKNELGTKMLKKIDATSLGQSLLNTIDTTNNDRKDSLGTSNSKKQAVIFWNEIEPGKYQTEFRKINEDGSIEVITETKTDSSSQIIGATIPKEQAKTIQANNPKLNLDLLQNQTGIMTDIFKELYYYNSKTEIHKRIDIKRIKSDLDQELVKLNVPKEGYYFGILNEDKNTIYCNHLPEDPDERLKIQNLLARSSLKTKLFPNDILAHSNYLILYIPQKENLVNSNLRLMIISSVLFIALLVYVFYKTINTIFNQKKNAEIKNDFINNMTHELKTPISTISLACQALSDPDILNSNKLTSKYITTISEENKRLGLLVEQVLNTALLEKGHFELHKQKINIHTIINKTIKSLSLQIQKKNVQVEVEFNAPIDEIYADQIHITNAIYNLLDNSIKYSPKNPIVKIKTEILEGYFMIKVQDNGIGIPEHEKNHIFEKLYRIPTGNIHNVKGFGLGLNYVKTIVEKHNGFIDLKSTVGKGSSFMMHLPIDPSH